MREVIKVKYMQRSQEEIEASLLSDLEKGI
jgi:hypothetical protein